MNVMLCYIVIFVTFICFGIVIAESFDGQGQTRISEINITSEHTNPDISGTNSQTTNRSSEGKIYYKQIFRPVTRFHKKTDNKGNTFLRKAILENYTKCTTPNNDTGYCTSLDSCSVLEKVVQKPNNKEFLQNSLCDHSDSSLKYCCGKYENYKYLLPKRPLPKECGYDSLNYLKKGRIHGGTKAKLGEFPWMARIIHTSPENEKVIGCAGFLVHKRFIVTAAHCVKTSRIALIGNITEIQLGEHNTETEKDCNDLKCADPLQTMKVKSIIPHPEYRHNSRDHHYDIALIYLKGEAKFSNYVTPICLSDKSTIPEAYFLSGWGKTENGTYSSVKMKLSVPPFDITECNQLYSRLHASVGMSQFCAGGQKGKDSCVGDSGGPLMFYDNENKWFAIGVVSYGVSCGLEGWPGVYTSIPYFHSWITNEIIKLREPNLLKNHTSSV